MSGRTSRVVLAFMLASTAACSADKLGPDGPPPPKDAGGAADTAPPIDASTPTDASDASVTPTPTPFPAALNFRNDTGAPVFLHIGCAGLDYGLSSASSGFRDSLGPTYRCGCYCEEESCTGPLACGQCPQPAAEEVGPRGATVVDWDGQLITDDVKPRAGTSGTFACFRSRALPAGSYRVAIRVFDDEASAVANVGGRLVTRDFDLPTANNAVDVPLSVNPLDNCDPEPNAAAPPCTGAEAHDVRCSLVSPLSFAWEGGLALWGDSSQLTPQNAYDRVRDFYQDTTRPDMTCTAAVPRCSRDSRVVTASDVTRVVNEPSVVAAFGAGPPVYGYDDRANDGTVLILRRPDGRGVVIGSPCAGCFVANPVTPALLAINPVLRGLEQQMLSTDGCAGFRSPGASF